MLINEQELSQLVDVYIKEQVAISATWKGCFLTNAKVKLIKELRIMRDCGLKEAGDAVDEVYKLIEQHYVDHLPELK